MNSCFQDDTTKTSLSFDEKENDKIVLYLADLYGKSYSAYVDKSYGNTPMAYAILTNRPEVVKKFFSEIDGTGALYRGNKNHVTPLHLMFSPEIKGKDMTALNDLILSNIESFKLKGIVYNGWTTSICHHQQREQHGLLQQIEEEVRL